MDPQLIEAGKETISRGVGWLKRNQSQIATLSDLSAHYKAPYLYAAIGDPVQGRHYAKLIFEKYQKADGDFRTAEKEKGWAHLACSPANRYIYSNGWVICGLRRLGYYGAAEKGMNFVRRFQTPKMGGFASRFEVHSGNVNLRFLDSSSTSSAGLALLACGDIKTAIQAGEFILRLLDAQPDPDKYYYCSWDEESGLMTDIWGNEDTGALRGRKQFCLSTETDPRYELTWLVGKPMKFLAKLYDMTGENRFLEGARRLLSFFERLDHERVHNYGSCKIMWASAELYRLTGETHFAKTAEEIFQWFCESMTPEGIWVHGLWYKHAEEQPLAASLDAVQELCAEMSDTIFELAV
ncbi:MAG: hypothetical protein CVU94_02350 [Firmicutes bacterium HGW-Firmicutes-19]|jgi:hypothetical protein|nr:MAG: hypothetical protein CVU94_02350 [Firmicutes bacterium HGW-Firmicutes-19]